MKIQVTQSSMPEFEEYVEEIKELWDSKWLTNRGAKHNELEEQLKSFLKVERVSLFTNGHMALELLLQALELEGEVITTPFTFASTTHAIVRNGLTPVFCDIDPETYTMDVEKIEELITDKTSAILPVHVYGNICDVEKIDEIAKRHKLKVIYDAAHAFGEEVNGRGIGSFGDASMFSFHATKVFQTIEGGAVTFGDPELEDLLNSLKNFGLTGPETADYVGSNAKMNEFQAAMGLCNLRHIDREIEKRKGIVEHYQQGLAGIEGLGVWKEQEGIKCNYAYFPVVFEGGKSSRDRVFEELKQNEIYARKYFYPLTSSFACFKGKYKSEETPVAKNIADSVLCLPLYAELSLEDVERICRIIKETR